MPLWGSLDNATSNQKPLFANTSNGHSNSTIHGSAANTNAYYGNVMGVSGGEMSNVAGPGRPQHSGWVSQKIGTGPIKTVTISGAGTGYNANGFLTFTDSSYLKQGANFNASYTIANSQNTLQSFSTNPAWNAISSVTINSGGDGFSNVTATSVTALGSNISAATFAITLGGRAGRINYETLVATGSMTGDDPKDNVYFTGV